MRKCRRTCLCSACPVRDGCPRKVRLDKRSRRPLAASASLDLVRRAASVLATGWFTSYRLGTALYGVPAQTKSGRMGVMVRARRPLNRLLAMGVLAVRPRPRRGCMPGTVSEYTITPEGLEALGC